MQKTAIITGASRGMGRNTAVNLAKRGVDVIFTYHSNKTEAESLIREIEAMGRKAAVSRLDTGDLRAFDGFVADVRKTLQGWGRDKFDYLVNNAGSSQHINFEQMTEANFDAVVNVHFKGVYFLTQKLLPLMNDGGRIVNISSGLTRVSWRLCVRSREGGHRSSHTLSSKRAGAAQDHYQRCCTGCSSDGFQWRHGTRQS